jgi:metallophosphoesterase (TIGR03767 family)
MALAALAAGVTPAISRAGSSSDTAGHTTVEQRIVPNADAGFRELALGPGESYVVREEGVGTAKPGRPVRRRSLAYFGQLSDFQLADEESPARVEFLDPFGPPVESAWRPWEALEPQIDDAMIRQLNAFADASPIAAGNGSRREMDLAINTGDIADSQQLNETRWSRTLMEGGALRPGSGVDPATGGPLCALLDALGLVADGNAPGNYTGVQDYRDYREGSDPPFYDPNQPAAAFAGWPRYRSLMNHSQRSFQAAGLDVPSYVTFGNHDALVQGNAAAKAALERVATGCFKLMLPLSARSTSLQRGLRALTPARLRSLAESDPTKVAFVPPDERRQFVSKREWKRVYLNGIQADGHGFAYIDPAVESASRGAAGYYAWSPVPGFRFISLDTVSEAGVIGPSADGNVDDPQFRWLRDELEDATDADQLVVLFSHHGIPSLTANVPDELAPACTVNDPHGHDVNPGCDLDPRNSAPIHLGQDMVDLLHQYPHVIAWVAGHSHVNDIEPFPNPGAEGGYWSIRVAAEADWPQQSRLLEIFDNRDGTLSIFGTILDHASPATAAPSGTQASTLDVDGLASIGRTLSYNDLQRGERACPGCGAGDLDDRNLELLVEDPRRGHRLPP